MAFLIKNKFGSSNSVSNISIANIKDKKILKIKGARAYNFFDINDSITLSGNEALENPVEILMDNNPKKALEL